MSTYDKGDLVRISAQFKDLNGTLIDPSVVLCQVKDGTGATTTPSPVHDSLGNYHVDVDANSTGSWFYRFYSTGTGQAAAEGTFFVETNF